MEAADDEFAFLQTENGLVEKQTLPLTIQKLIQKYQHSYSTSQGEGEMNTIHVDEIASKVAAVYEKIRKIVDWKEEHLIRRAAIERILKRRLLSEISGINLITNLDAKKMAEPLVLELIRGGHFPNDTIQREKINDTQRILQKYIYILKNNKLAKNHAPIKIKEKVQFYNWILGIAACEIEELLGPAIKENALIEYMTNLVIARLKPDPRLKISQEEKIIQTYIAVHRALFRLDAPIISYHLIKYRYREFLRLSESQLEQITTNIFKIWAQIEKDLAHPIAGEFYKICEKYDTPYLVLGDILEVFAKKPWVIEENLSDPQNLKKLILKAYNKRLSTLKKRLFRAALYSTLSILIASGFSLFIIEVPLAKLFYGRFSPLAVAVDILVPTLFMFFLVVTIKLPKEANLHRVITEVGKIVYITERKDVCEIRLPKKRGLIGSFIISFLYLLGCGSSLALIVWIFWVARVPIPSVILDTINVAMIVFAGLVIRQRAKEMIIEEKISFWEFSLDFLSVPIGKIGQWFSSKWKEYNIISVFLTALVDMPFSTFIEFVENWSSFLKEKKAGIH